MSDVPILTEEQLQEHEWICDACQVRVEGPCCPECGAPPPEGMIVVPDGCDGEVMERLTSKERCGACRHFDLRMGQEMINSRKDPIFLRLIHEMELRSVATNMDWKVVGLCRYWTGGRYEEHFTCATSPARVNRWRLDSSVSHKEKDQNVKCPAFAPRSASDGREIRSYRQVRGSRTVGTD